MQRFVSFALASFVLLFASFAMAQEEEFIEEAPEVQVNVKAPKPALQLEGEEEGEEAAALAKPDPNYVIVAIVNGHALTRAQLDQRMAIRVGNVDEYLEEKRRRDSGVVSISGAARISALEAEVRAREREEEVRTAIRREEGEVVREWVEHKMLADEARRHSLAISEQAMQVRLNEERIAAETTDAEQTAVLRAAGMSQGEFEELVYEALLIDALLDEYTRLNISEGELRAAYDARPDFYYIPAQYRVAHFVAVVYGDETRNQRNAIRNRVEEVRKRLSKGEDPERVFADLNDAENGFLGTDVGFFNIEQKGLPAIVRHGISKLKVGQTSSILEAKRRISDGSVVTESYHVVKLIDMKPETGTTFESARPQLQVTARLLARKQVVELLQARKSHRVIVNLGGIPPSKLPSRDELLQPKGPVDFAALR